MVGTKHSDGGFLVCSVVPTVQNSRPAQRRVRPKQGGAVLGRCVDAVYYVRPEYVCALCIKVYIKVWQFVRPSIPVPMLLLP